MELTAAEMLETGVQVTVEAPPEPLMVRVDGEVMQQAVLNLLLNGMQAMRDGGRMRVSLRRDHQFAVVEVADEGEGIPPELLPRIFELYFTTKPKGSGIGLAMTYRILQMHGGAMDVRSNADAASVTMRSPSRMTVIRSATCNASSSACEMKMMETPRSLSRSTSEKNWCFSSGVSVAVGSSKMMACAL